MHYHDDRYGRSTSSDAPTAQRFQSPVWPSLLVGTIYDWIDLGFLRSTVREMTGTSVPLSSMLRS